MGYTKAGGNGDLLDSLVVTGHAAESYSVFIAFFEKERWATVLCSCGVESRALWDDTVVDYAGLVRHAWFLGCGFILPRDTEVFKRHDETYAVTTSDVMNRVYGSRSR